MQIINDSLRNAVEDYLGLYKIGVKKFINEASEEFVIRYLEKCYNLLVGKPTYPERVFEWSTPIRRALDYYFSTGDVVATSTRLRKMPNDVPLLYVNKFGEAWTKKIQKECDVTIWNVTCDRVVRFLEKYNLTLDDVYFEVHNRWPGKDAVLYEAISTRPAPLYKGWLARPCLYIIAKGKKKKRHK